jgi:hypothetical protein
VFSRLFNFRDQRHRAGMIVEFFFQFTVELIRALLVEELSRRVRFVGRSTNDTRRTIVNVHRRNRERLINKLLTDLEAEL